jgi:hypothetical protein
LVDKKLKTAFTLDEAVKGIRRSKIRQGQASKGPFWWDLMAGMKKSIITNQSRNRNAGIGSQERLSN